MKLDPISSEVGLATRTSEKPTLKKPVAASTQNATPSPKTNGPGTIGINAGTAAKSLQDLTPLVNGLGLGLEFSTDPETGQKVIKVLDLKTGATIRQIPPQEVLAFLRQIQNNKTLASGVLVSRHL
jgi:uncharacterized FlaG/YvyC family protein